MKKPKIGDIYVFVPWDDLIYIYKIEDDGVTFYYSIQGEEPYNSGKSWDYSHYFNDGTYIPYTGMFREKK